MAAPFPRTRTVTFAAPSTGTSLVPGRRDGRAGGSPSHDAAVVVGGGCLGLKDEAPLQSCSEHGTRKRNVSSRLPANRRRCNPPFVSPESRGSLVLIGFWFFFYCSRFWVSTFASCRVFLSRGLRKWALVEEGKMGRVVCARGSLPRHLTFLPLNLLCPTAGPSSIVAPVVDVSL